MLSVCGTGDGDGDLDGDGDEDGAGEEEVEFITLKSRLLSGLLFIGTSICSCSSCLL